MDLSDEWKSIWPISSVFSAPLLLSGVGTSNSSSKFKEKVGPLFFNPFPQTPTLLFSSPSLSPSLPPPLPHLSLSRFLSTTPSLSSSSSLLPCTSSTVATNLGLQLLDITASLRHNRLQLLRYPDSDSIIVFFPTGNNSDLVGFVILSIEDSELKIRGDGYQVFTAKNQLNHRIFKLLVNPVEDSCSGSSNSVISIGYLMACTMYAVHWFSVRIKGTRMDSEMPQLEFLGSKSFNNSVAHACWSPHLPEESLVLLDSGVLYLFDLDSYSNSWSSNARFNREKLKVPWKDSGIDEGGWLSCEFSWHPRILIIAHFSAIFLVDLRYGKCSISCLLKIDNLALHTSVQNERFLALSKAGSDGFTFVVASDHLVLLCDVRRPFMPVLQWKHDLANPSHINVLALSELRSHYKDDCFKWASELGYCIVVGSFWNSQFNLFCYGPPLGGTVASEVSRFCKSFYAWELPSELLVSGRECPCGSCLLREEFAKVALPEWIDWRQKKEIALGFGILDKDLHAKLSQPGGYGGFTLIRLMSSGKLELQRYQASWEFIEVLKEAHKESSLRFEDSLLYTIGDGDYTLPKRFKYLELNYLRGYMEGNLSKILCAKVKNPNKHPQEKDSFTTDFNQYMCDKLKGCGISRVSFSPDVCDVFKDVLLLTSIHELATRKIWASLPMDLLQLAFSCYSEFLEVLVDNKKVSLEFLEIPSCPQLPPFVFRTPSSRSSKWSQKVQPGNAFVGPVLPTPVLLALHKLRMEEKEDLLSANDELSNQCSEVMRLALDMNAAHNEYAVSLADNSDNMCSSTQNLNNLSLHKPGAFSCKFCAIDPTTDNFIYKNESFTTFVSKTPQKEPTTNARMKVAGPELFNSLSAVELKFDDHTINFGAKELKTFKLLRRQYSNFLQSF